MEQQQGGTLPDPAWAMGVAAQGGPKSTIEARISHWGDHVSISFSVSLECPQTDAYMQAAAELASGVAASYINELASRFDNTMPMLPTGG